MQQKRQSKRMLSSHRSPRRSQRGVLLEISLLLLVMLTLLGAMMARSQLGEERMAQNEDNRQLAMQAAESFLRSGEAVLLNNAGSLSFSGSAAGLYTLTPGSTSTNPLLMPSLTLVPSTQTVNQGSLTTSYALMNAALVGASGGSAGLAKLTQKPSLTIFQLPSVVKPGNPGSQNSQQSPVYELTAYAYGADLSSIVTLQSFWQ